MNRRRPAVMLAILAIALCMVGCDEARSSPRPSASLLDVEFTQRATRTAATPTGAPTDPGATFASPPVGWDRAFCSLFADAVAAQELVIDIERALDEDDVRDARGLARDLRDTTAEAIELLGGLADWVPASAATLALATQIDLASRAAAEYGTFFTDETRNALRRARALRREIATATPGANEALAELVGLGIDCDGQPLELEEF